MKCSNKKFNKTCTLIKDIKELISDIKESKKVIRNQLFYNEKRNIFYMGDSPWFNIAILYYIEVFRKKNSIYNIQVIFELINYYLDLFKKRFYNVNQYIDFDLNAENDIQVIFLKLFNDIRNTSIDIKNISDRHRKRIYRLIKSSNPLIYKINFNNKEKAYPFICEEYNAEFLMEILGINSIDLNEPILDIAVDQEIIL